MNLTLEPMSPSNVEEFVTRWHNSLQAEKLLNQPEDLAQMAENLKQQLRQRTELRRLASTPLLCAMICALHQERRETLPSSRLQLYSECIDMLLNRRDAGRRIPLDETYPIGLDENQKTELLQSLALKLMRLDRSNLETDRVDSHFDTELRKTSLSQAITGRQIRELFTDRAGLLRSPIVGSIDFAHRTFQEYLAAKAALADDGLEELLQKVTDDQWRESIIVAAGLARPREREQLLKALIERGNAEIEIKSYLHFLAIACLETATSVEPDTRTQVLNCARALLPPKDDDEVMMAVRAGNEIIPLLAFNPGYSVEEACWCIQALVQIGTSAAMQMLVDYAKAPFELKQEQYEISSAIERGWYVFEQTVYLSNVLSYLSILDLHITGISDISSLRPFTQLNVLDLSDTQVTDVSPLQNLTQLTELDLYNTQVTDVSPLQNLTQLTVLDLNDTQVTDVSPLQNLTQLTVLGLSNTQVTDVSSLQHLSNLHIYSIDN